MFYEKLTGKVPFESNSGISIAVKHLTDAIPPLPPEFAAYQSFLDRLTAKDRDKRFASGADVLKALREFEGDQFPARTLMRSAERPSTGTPTAAVMAPTPFARLTQFTRDRRWSIGFGMIAITTLVVGVELWVGGLRDSSARIAEPQNSVASPTDTSDIVSSVPPGNSAADAVPQPLVTAPATETPAADAMLAQTSSRSNEPARDPEANIQPSKTSTANIRKQIEDLLVAADEAYIIGSLSAAEGHYRAVLKLDAKQADAIAGLGRIAQVLAVREGRGATAEPAVSVSASPQVIIQPGHSGTAPHRREQRDQYREHERDTQPAQYDGRIDVPMPNVPGPTFNASPP